MRTNEKTVRAALRGMADETLTVDAQIDRAGVHLCLPERLARQLKLTERDQRVVSGMSVPYVGPIQLTVGERTICCGAVITGDSVRLGIAPLADLESN